MVYSQQNFRKLQKDLFPNIVEKDFLHFYFIENFFKNAKRLKRIGAIEEVCKLDLGKESQATLTLKFTNFRIQRFGDELTNELFSLFNDKYWLVTLWLSMYKDSESNSLAREILRAFIKSCISQSTKEAIIECNCKITKNNICSLLPNKFDFYSAFASSKSVYKNMRLPFREKLKRHSNSKDTKYIEENLIIDEDRNPNIKHLLNECGMGHYTSLMNIAKEYATPDDLVNITRTISLFINNTIGKRHFKRTFKSLTQASNR